jgi:transcriptional regulator with XRE-family HTH domain
MSAMSDTEDAAKPSELQFALASLGNNVRRERKRRKMTQTNLCGEAGVSRDTLSRLERGEAVDTTSLMRIVLALRCELSLAKSMLSAAGQRRRYAHLHADEEN